MGEFRHEKVHSISQLNAINRFTFLEFGEQYYPYVFIYQDPSQKSPGAEGGWDGDNSIQLSSLSTVKCDAI